MNAPRRIPFLVLSTLALVVLSYFLIAGFSERRSFYRSLSYHFYELEAQALLRGELTFPVEPRSELLALPNPYDSAQNHPYRLQDMALAWARLTTRGGRAAFAVTVTLLLGWSLFVSAIAHLQPPPNL